MRKHLRAWGHETLPDIDIQGDDLEAEIKHARQHYPCIVVAMMGTISYSAVMKALTAQERSPK